MKWNAEIGKDTQHDSSMDYGLEVLLSLASYYPKYRQILNF